MIDHRRPPRRAFLKSILAAGGAATLASCDPNSYWDYLTMEEDAKVNDRVNESLAGHAKQLTFPAAASNQFSFLWCSDIHISCGEDDHVDKLGAYAQKVNAVFLLHSGDLADDGEKKEYEEWWRLWNKHGGGIPFYSALGNHDTYNDGWDDYKWMIGPSVFRFAYGPCDFVFIDAASGTLGHDQLNWLERELKDLDRANRFVLGHYPLYDGEFQTPASMGDTEERMFLFSLFDDANIDYYLCGHKHTGRRDKVRDTRQIISGAACPYKQILNDKNHFYRFDIDGGQIHAEKIYMSEVG